MRITKLKLVNFIGIHNGLGRDEVEIEFPKSDHVFVKLSGKNGSGKTTILSQLHPFKDSFDERKSVILPGKEGEKIICIEHDGHEYEIRHIYRKAGASFFYEDGLLLNENGAVKVCEDLISQKLGITPEYFQVGKIGSNTASFVDLTPAKRKEYIGTFIPSLDKYLDAYKIANDKYKNQKRKIDETSALLAKYQDPEALKASIEVDKSNQIGYTNKINELSTILGGINANINTEKEKIVGLDSRSLNAKLSEYDILIGNDSTLIQNYEKDHGVEKIDKLNKKVYDEGVTYTKNEAALETKRQTLSTLQGNKITISNAIDTLKIQISNLKLDNYDSIVEAIAKDEARKKELDDAISTNAFYKNIDLYKGTLSSEVANFRALMREIYDNYDQLNQCTVEENKKNITLLFTHNYRETFLNYARTLKEKSDGIKNSLDTSKTDKAQKEANLDQLDILEKRPSDCHIDSCPFIVNALKYKNLPEELKSLDTLIEKLGIENKQIDEDIETCKALNDVFKRVSSLFSTMTTNNIVYKYFIETYGNITSFFDGVHNKEQFFASFNDAISTCTSALEIFNEYSSLEVRLSSNKSQKELMDSSAKNKEIFEKQIKDKEEELKRETENYTKLFEEYNNEKTALESQKTALEELKKYVDAKTAIDGLIRDRNEVAEKIKVLEKATGTIQALTDTYNEKNDIKNTYVAEKEQLDKDLDRKKIEYAEVTRLKKSLEELQKEYESTKLVADALNPKSGIPLVFIQSYLTSVESITNKLLDIAYGDHFRIKFNVTEKEFLITVKIGESVIDDISFASQGELALTTISLSLALIERAINKYNIIALDEIDGPLDPDNRASFIGILNSQIKKLGLEQVFLISHNNAFDSCPMDLVLLKDAPDDLNSDEYMKNKTIIFKY